MRVYLRAVVRHTTLSVCMLVLAMAGTFIGCKLNLNDEVQGLATSKARTVAAATVTPGAGSEYAFTIENQPSIEITCPVSGSEAFYSIDGGPYQRYTGPFTLPIADPKVDQTITVSAYVSHPDYRDSAPVSQTYRFVATTVPAPTFSATEGAAPYHEYYRYDGPPTITASSSLAGSTLWYSVDGGTSYTEYTGPFALPVPADKGDWDENRNITLTMRASSPKYRDSATVSATYAFYGQYAIVTIAGTGEKGSLDNDELAGLLANEVPFIELRSICRDKNGRIYILDRMSEQVYSVDTDGSITVFADSSVFSWPTSLAYDADNNVLFVADDGHIHAFTLDDGIMHHFAGWGSSDNEDDSRLIRNIFPVYLFFTKEETGGTLFFTDDDKKCVYEVDASLSLTDSKIHKVAGNNASLLDITLGMAATEINFESPKGICADEDFLYIADYYSSVDTSIIYRVGRKGSKSLEGTVFSLDYGDIGQPWLDGDNLYFSATSASQHVVYQYGVTSKTNTIITGGAKALGVSQELEGIMPGSPSLNEPAEVCVVPHDGIYVADFGNCRLRKVLLY